MERSLISAKTADSREIHYSGKVAIGGSEAVGVQSPVASKVGITVTKVASKTGRYKLKFSKTHKHLKSITATYINADPDVLPAGTVGEAGKELFLANNIATTGEILFQARQVSGAAAAITSGVVVTFHAIFSDE